MRAAAAAMGVVGALLIGFGWWGLETVPGQRRFDEMSGMIPLGAGFLGALVLLVALAVLFVDARRRGSR